MQRIVKKSRKKDKELPVESLRGRNNNFGLVAIIVILAIAFLGLASFVFYDKYGASMWSKDSSALDSASADPSNYQVPLGIFAPQEESQQSDPTLGWKVYSFDAASSTAISSSTGKIYSFKYPELLRVENSGNFVRLFNDATSSPVQITINFEKSEKSLNDWMVDLDTASATAWEGKPSFEVVTTTQATFSGAPAIMRQQKMLAADMMSYALYFKKGENIFTVSVMSSALTKEMVDLYLMLVNTFQF